MSAQTELFADDALDRSAVGWKTWEASGGRMIRYKAPEGSSTIELQFADGEECVASRYRKKTGSDQFRLIHPRFGVVFSRYHSVIAFLAAVAQTMAYTEERERAERAEAESAKHRAREKEERVRAEIAEAEAAKYRSREREHADAMKEALLTAEKNSRRAVRSNKLCLEPVEVTWPQERYIPRGAPGGFSRVPECLIPASKDFASGEYRLLQAILRRANSTGLLHAGKKTLGREAGIDPADYKRFMESLRNRAILRLTGRTLPTGVQEHELVTGPVFGCGEISPPAGEILPAGSQDFPPPGGEKMASTREENSEKPLRDDEKPFVEGY